MYTIDRSSRACVPCLMSIVYISGISIGFRSMPRLIQSATFRVDKPFMYIIKEQNTQGLFWGSVRRIQSLKFKTLILIIFTHTSYKHMWPTTLRSISAGMIMSRTGYVRPRQIKTFRCDKPFLYTISDSTNTLFVGSTRHL